MSKDRQTPKSITVSTPLGAWCILQPAEKLRLRATLPGASLFDRAVAGLREARRGGASLTALLPAAMASSWFVNSGTHSPVFRRWLDHPNDEHWVDLIAALDDWSTGARRSRDALRFALEGLAAGIPGSAAAISKVAASLSFEAVPLMPDAAISFFLRGGLAPAEPDRQSAGIDVFVPMLVAFKRAEDELRRALDTDRDSWGPRAGDMLDRLLWFDSVGHRFFKSNGSTWVSVRRGSTCAVVPVPGEGHGQSWIDLDSCPTDLAARVREAWQPEDNPVRPTPVAS